MSKTTTKSYKDYSKILKAYKDRVLVELDRIKQQAIKFSPSLKRMIDEKGEDFVIKVHGGSLPFEIDGENIWDYNALGVEICDKTYTVWNESYKQWEDRVVKGVHNITVTTLEGDFSFDLRDIVRIEKRIKSLYPASISEPSKTPNRIPNNHSGCDVIMLLENIEQAKKAGNLKLVAVFEKEMESFGYYKTAPQVEDESPCDTDNGISAKQESTIELKNMNIEQTYTTGWLEALKPICSTADWHTGLKGVLVDGEHLVASNGHVLVKVCDPRFKAKSGMILDPLTAEELVILNDKSNPVKIDYPNYERVLEEESKKVPLKFAKAEIKGFLYAKRKKEFYAELAFVKMGAGDCFTCVYENLFDAVTVLETYGASTISFRYTGPKEALMIYADNGNLAIIQPTKERCKESDVTTIELKAITKEEDPILPDSQKSHTSLKQIKQQNPQIVHKVLAIDIETYSPVELKKAGLYVYSAHPEFEIQLFAYAFDNGPVQVVDLTMLEDIPEEVILALTDPSILKTAHNANFERICIGRYLGKELPVEHWECTMIKGAMAGLPFSLDAVGKALKIEKSKMSEGKALIRYFSMPCKETKKNEGRTRNMPEHDLEKWNTYKMYNGRDVEAEREIRGNIAFYPVTQFEKDLYALDQRINDRGIMVDQNFVNNAIRMDAINKDNLTVEATEITSLDNPNSVSQLKAWIAEETGEDVEKLTKEAILDMLKTTPSDEVTRVLKIRQEMAKTSVKKYQAMTEAVGADSRIRGLLQFYGANRTGRWAGRLVQVQNLPQNHLSDLDLARKLVSDNDLEMLEMLFGNVPDTLSQLIRTAFIAKSGHVFHVADFSAIEARVIAWLADEKWRLEVFATHGKIYEASASQMFKVPIEEVTKGSPLRQKGKVSELALGYQGGAGALAKMGALKMGLTEEELPGLVDAWRAANKRIVLLWRTVGDAALKAVDENTIVTIQHGVSFEGRGNVLFITLPSGRKLSYWKPVIGENRFGSSSLKYEGLDQTTKQWCYQETYGGKLVENIVQAIARDCLAVAMINLDKAGYEICMHVHDEVIIESDNTDKLEDICHIMGQPISWAKGLLLRADGYTTSYYKKD